MKLKHCIRRDLLLRRLINEDFGISPQISLKLKVHEDIWLVLLLYQWWPKNWEHESDVVRQAIYVKKIFHSLKRKFRKKERWFQMVLSLLLNKKNSMIPITYSFRGWETERYFVAVEFFYNCSNREEVNILYYRE